MLSEDKTETVFCPKLLNWIAFFLFSRQEVRTNKQFLIKQSIYHSFYYIYALSLNAISRLFILKFSIYLFAENVQYNASVSLKLLS